MTDTILAYPPAPRADVVEERHGLRIADPYRWLEDSADPRTATWTERQRELYAAWRTELRHTAAWRARLAELFSISLESVPVRCAERFFRTVRPEGADLATLLVRDGDRERTLFDPAAHDPSGRTVLEAWEPSLDGELVAVQHSAGGTEDCLLVVLDVRTGDIVDGPIDRVRRTPVAWLPGGGAFFYVRRLAPELIPGEERYHRRVYRHEIGTDPASDLMVFGAGRERTQFYHPSTTPDGRWLLITATAGANPDTELWLADLAATPAPVPRPVLAEVTAANRLRFGPDTAADAPVWLQTDLGAARGRLVGATLADPSVSAWHEVIPERPDAVLTRVAILHGPELPTPLGLAVWTRHAISEITVHDLAGGRRLGTVPLPGLGTVENLTVPPAGGAQAWFRYSDHRTPPAVLRFDARTWRVEPWPAAGAARAVPGVRTGALSCVSRDGTAVRMFVLSPTGAPDRPRPAILTGYGGFGVSMVPGYMPHALAWVRAGGVFAIGCLRGGGEEGADWHRAGRAGRKQNAFDDFEAAGDLLVGAGWTARDRLGILGSSNGGLLVGAALTQHPEKYAAAVSMSPLLDMIRYERTGLGPSWRAEYGSADDPEDLRTLLSYSPYHRVEPGVGYPPTLLTVAAADTRVDPAHARKMCAALQAAVLESPSDRPILLRVEREAGHGTRAVSQGLELLADVLAFFGHTLGLEPG